ncbi:hypothetical protein ACVIW2_006348 [Bradyrhizobium huanghuaihaiense]|jgi:hypothetical protein|uniref:Bsr8262 protein n=7 Tax=Bradyrhizobium TaxID=374 RepID=Q89BA2_BRADU|nr:hypothetical protein BKD09_47580 [Bradyrhizobium japonicum]APO57059.1 hypothetical protein BD122_42216 [Bradyrhizobium diazoefficiens]AWL93372.1 hypothetical protein CIT37_15160 [Bradyrhizobium ottawaense]MBP1291672.1 hypothetical protein [Bradyrhizobium elkanii]MCS3900324.1 hypothetical protein [Bradyrhizobium japonicum USDA 38]MCS4008664.1 hypothetical protein [Bradyrhizobium elkanii USDA 61]NLS74715.1 hypothetical protein [Bradyrhizobium brasilense]QOZ14423.1 hypothetical protein XI02_
MPRKLPPNVERNVVKGHAYLSFRIGKAWHLPQYGDASTPAGATRFNRKVRQQQRYAKQRAERLAAMTPRQRATHDAWHRARRPGLWEAIWFFLR